MIEEISKEWFDEIEGKYINILKTYLILDNVGSLPIEYYPHRMDNEVNSLKNLFEALSDTYKSYKYNVAMGNTKGVELLKTLLPKRREQYEEAYRYSIDSINWYYDKCINK